MREVTYSTPLGPVAGPISQAMNNPALLPIKIMFFPFYKIAVNLAKFGIDRSPLALMTKRFAEDMAAGGIQRAEALSRMGLGSALLGIGGMLAANGIITGAAPNDRAYSWVNANVPEYAIGDPNSGLIRYNRLDPLAMWLGVGADVHSLIEQRSLPEDKQENLITGALMILSNNFASKTYLKSLSEMMDVLFRPDRMNLGKWGRRQIGSYFPFSTGADAVQRERDPIMREPADAWEAFVTQHVTPEDLLPRRHAVYGTPVLRTQRLLGAFDTMKMEEDPVLREMWKVGANIGPPSKITRIGGERVELTPHQLDKYNELLSQLPMKEYLSRIIGHPSYQRIADSYEGLDLKAKILKDAVGNFRRIADKLLIKEDPSIIKQVKGNLQNRVNAIIGINTDPMPNSQLQHWLNFINES
jgi:hypothetical protein